MDNTVDIAVRWAEAGQDVPARARAQLDGLRLSAGQTAGELNDRLTRAFARVEASEPTFAIRRLRFAMDELAASAVGLTGQWGRVIAAFGMMEFGGAIAAVGALVLEVKTLVEFSDQLDTKLEKLNTRFATLGGPGATGLAQAAEIRAMEPEQPGWAIRLFARLGTLGSSSLSPLAYLRPEESGEGDLNQAIQTGFASQEATFATMANIADQRADDARRREHLRAGGDLLKQIGSEAPGRQVADLVGRKEQFTALGTEGGEAWGKALLAAIQRQVPDTAVRDLVARRQDFLTLGGDAGSNWAKALLTEIGRQQPDQAYRNLLANRAAIQAAGADAAEEWNRAFLANLARGPGLTPRTELQPLLRTKGPLADGFFGKQGQRFLLTTSDSFQVPAATFPTFGAESVLGSQRTVTGADGFPVFGSSGFNSFRRPGLEGKEDTKGEQVAEHNAEKIAAALGRELGPLIAMMSGGGARGAVAGLAGITGTLASLNDPKTGKALLGAEAPYLSLASGVLSGLTSLFGIGGGQKPKVIIAAFEEEAARQIKELRSDPATTQFIIIGSSDMRSTQMQLARLQRMGVITRLPR